METLLFGVLFGGQLVSPFPLLWLLRDSPQLRIGRKELFVQSMQSPQLCRLDVWKFEETNNDLAEFTEPDADYCRPTGLIPLQCG